MRVASNDNGTGNGGKSNGNGDKGAGRATTRAMTAAMTVAVMRVASNEEDDGAGWATTRAMVAASTMAAMRVASNKEGEGGKAMETVTRLAGEQRRRQWRGQWQWQQGWQARMPWPTAQPWWCSFLGWQLMRPLFLVGHVLSWRKRYVRNYVFAFCACGWGLSSSFHEIGGGKGMFLCFYVFWKQACGHPLKLLRKFAYKFQFLCIEYRTQIQNCLIGSYLKWEQPFHHPAVITSFSFVKWEWQWPPSRTSLQVHYLETRAPKTPNWLQTPHSID
jgi:hypothetical protein